MSEEGSYSEAWLNQTFTGQTKVDSGFKVNKGPEKNA